MLMFKQGDILVDKQGNERKVLGMCGEIYALTKWTIYDYQSSPGAWMWMSLRELEDGDWTLKQEKWKPKSHDIYFYLDSNGDICSSCWDNDIFDIYQYRLSIGNIHRTKEDALAYKEKLINWASENK